MSGNYKQKMAIGQPPSWERSKTRLRSPLTLSIICGINIEKSCVGRLLFFKLEEETSTCTMLMTPTADNTSDLQVLLTKAKVWSEKMGLRLK